ncbi:MAG: serine/threonine-protein kinase, partial [Planctomycetota bacterium]
MAKRIKCPDKKWFERLVDGKVSAEQEAKLSAHLDQCKFCQRIMDQLNSLEDLVGETKTLPRPTLATSSDSFRDRLAEIKSKEPSSQSSFAARGYMDVMPWIDESEEHLGRIGEFELLGFVGRGGMGVVFKAMDTKLQRLVALKLMSPQMLVDEAAKERFLREARSAAVISHANVVTVHAVDESRGLPYLVMEFVEGASLESQLQSEKPIPIPQIITISTQMARGLKAAHEKGVLHRDIKPANIMLVSRNSQVKIADFGLACTAEGSKLTRTGLLVGTPDFISPEQANSKPADPRSDLFSLGCVIYAMCSGESPFTGPTMMSTLDNVRSREPEPLGQINPELPSWLVRLVEQLLKKDPEQRMQSADDVIRRFENSETNTSLPFVDTRTSSAQISSQIRERQNSFVRAMLLLTASVVLAVAMISWWVYVGHQQAASSETVAGREEQIKSEPISQVRIEDDEFAENAASEVEDNPHLEEAEAHDDNEFDELHSFHVNSFAGIVNAIQSEHESMEIIVDVDEPLLLTAPIQIEGKLISLVAPDDNPAEMVVEFWDRAAIVAENSILRTENIQFEAVSKLEQDDEAFEVVEPLIHMGGGKLIIQNCIAYSNRPSPLFEVQGADIDMIGSGIATS